ncbi:MAG TPA: D-2-hydroxyacid dehydrogenase [Anaerolineales bacterium]|nr:D-2-hydroxyacid dehydrogenase [Anaerolineales bacterium]
MGTIAVNMPTLTILSKEEAAYRSVIEAATLPGLTISSDFENCDIVLGEPTMIRNALAALPRLKWVQSTWAGVEPLLDPSLRRDYILTNARGVFGGLMSEFILGYLLAHERKIFQRVDAQKNKKWDKLPTGTLRGKTVGLLGVGSIGAEVARTANFLGMHVRGFTRVSETCKYIDQYFHNGDLLKFAESLDYLIAILPNTKETSKIIHAEVFDVLPKHAVFINVGRGSAVDERDLIEALEQNKIAATVLDVFEQEPLPREHPFWEIKNLTMTFHTSAPSFPEDIAKVFIENYRLYIEGKSLNYQVDFERGY